VVRCAARVWQRHSIGKPSVCRPATDAADSTFNAGKWLAEYRASLIGWRETENTLRGISLQVLGRDASDADLSAYKSQFAGSAQRGHGRVPGRAGSGA